MSRRVELCGARVARGRMSVGNLAALAAALALARHRAAHALAATLAAAAALAIAVVLAAAVDELGAKNLAVAHVAPAIGAALGDRRPGPPQTR